MFSKSGFFNKVSNIAEKALQTVFAPANTGLSSTYEGPSYRHIKIDVTELAAYRATGGLANNCKGQSASNHSTVNYVNRNEKSPWFGGCAKLEDMHEFIKNSERSKSGLILLIGTVPPGDKRTKTIAYIDYYNECLDTSHFNEKEILHKGGDYDDLLKHVIRAEDLITAIKGEPVEDLLTKQMINIIAWEKRERAKVMQQLDQTNSANSFKL